MKAAILSLQQELVELLSDDYDVRMETVSVLPTLTVSWHGKDLLKVYPMKQGRFKVLDIELSRGSYQKHQYNGQFTMYVSRTSAVVAYAHKYTRRPF